MAMRSQVYEWSNIVGGAARGRAPGMNAAAMGAQQLDIFIGGVGNNITMPASTTATQFVVIEELAASPHSGGAVQIRINTTDYFQNPDVTDQAGIPGLASPYPRGAEWSTVLAASPVAQALDTNQEVSPSFSLYPDVYVLPGQTWTAIYDSVDVAAGLAATIAAAVFIKYTLYDGPDALIANKLLEMGVTVNPNNVDWYKRTLIEQQSAAAMAAVTNANGGA